MNSSDLCEILKFQGRKRRFIKLIKTEEVYNVTVRLSCNNHLKIEITIKPSKAFLAPGTGIQVPPARSETKKMSLKELHVSVHWQNSMGAMV